jgi:uncharacterized membrane protein
MATAKKLAKKAVKKVVKKTVSRAPVRKSNAKVSRVQSFKIAQETLPFLTFKITQQTFYWTVLLIFVLIVQVWVLNVQLSVADTLNSITPTL